MIGKGMGKVGNVSCLARGDNARWKGVKRTSPTRRSVATRDRQMGRWKAEERVPVWPQPRTVAAGSGTAVVTPRDGLIVHSS